MELDFASEDFLDALLEFFERHSIIGLLALQPHAFELVCVLAIIDFCTIWALYDGQMRLSLVISKVMKVGFFLLLIVNWNTINDAILKSFEIAGSVAAGLEPTGEWNTPSNILTMGFKVCTDILSDFHKTSIIENGGIARLFIDLLAMIITLASFFFISLQVLITKIEFYIFSSLGIILLPFGAIRFTSFLFQRVVSGVFAFGIKLMVMFFLLGLFNSVSDTLINIPVPGEADDGNFAAMLKIALSYATLAFLVWKLPNIAASMMNGQPSMEAGDVVRGARSATTTVAGAATGAAGAVSGAAEKAGVGYGFTNATIKAARIDTTQKGGTMSKNIAKNVARAGFYNSSLGRGILRGARYANKNRKDKK